MVGYKILETTKSSNSSFPLWAWTWDLRLRLGLVKIQGHFQEFLNIKHSSRLLQKLSNANKWLLQNIFLLSSPGPKPLAPKTQNQGAGLTLESHGPPPHPITFKHEGRVPHQNSKSKKGSEWSPLPGKNRWTTRGRAWVSPPCSRRTSSIFLV